MPKRKSLWSCKPLSMSSFLSISLFLLEICMSKALIYCSAALLFSAAISASFCFLLVFILSSSIKSINRSFPNCLAAHIHLSILRRAVLIVRSSSAFRVQASHPCRKAGETTASKNFVRNCHGTQQLPTTSLNVMKQDHARASLFESQMS